MGVHRKKYNTKFIHMKRAGGYRIRFLQLNEYHWRQAN